MVAKKEEGFFDSIKDVVSSTILLSLKDHMKTLVHKSQDIMYQTTKKVLDKIFAGALFITGIVFLFISFTFLISQYLKLTIGWSLFFVSLLLLLLSIIFHFKSKNKKYYDL